MLWKPRTAAIYFDYINTNKKKETEFIDKCVCCEFYINCGREMKFPGDQKLKKLNFSEF